MNIDASTLLLFVLLMGRLDARNLLLYWLLCGASGTGLSTPQQPTSYMPPQPPPVGAATQTAPTSATLCPPLNFCGGSGLLLLALLLSGGGRSHNLYDLFGSRFQEEQREARRPETSAFGSFFREAQREAQQREARGPETST